MRENGTVFRSLTHLAHHRNLISLCPNCHEAYNASPIMWCMPPEDEVLERFISHERQDYQERQAIAASSGLSPPRQTLESDPSFDVTTITYRIYFFNKEFRRSLCPMYYMQPEQRRWQGDPTAAIHKAFQGAFAPCRVKEIDIPILGTRALIGKPERTKHLLSELSVLWSRPHPVGQDSAPLRPIGTPNGPMNEGDGGSGGSDRKSRSPHHFSSTFDQKVSGTRSQNQYMDADERFSGSP